MEKDAPLNVFGQPLENCSESPLTGFFRDGCCNTNEADIGRHIICVQVSKAFLEYSRFRGNDLSTAVPEFGFPGLNEGDRWCLCATRWLEAYEHDMAPKVYLAATHIRATDIVPLEILKQYAIDFS